MNGEYSLQDIFGIADKYSKQYNMDPLVLRSLIMQESGGDPFVKREEPKGGFSRGLLQLYDYGRGKGIPDEDAFDPEKNIALSMPELSAAYRSAVEEGYSGPGLAMKVAELGQRPAKENLPHYGSWYARLVGEEPSDRVFKRAMKGEKFTEEQLGAGPLVRAGVGRDFSNLLFPAPRREANLEGLTPWSDIARYLDPLLSQKDYDLMREKYFFDNVAPRLKNTGASVTDEYEVFKQRTERKPLLNIAEKAYSMAALGSIEAVKGALPAGLVTQFADIHKNLSEKERVLQALMERDGVPTDAVKFIGEQIGMAVPITAVYGIANAATGGLAGIGLTALKGSQLLSRVARGGMAFGLYEAVREEGDDNRMISGLRGAAWGAGIDLGLGLFGKLKPGWISKEQTDKTAKDLLAGKTPETPLEHATDEVLSKKIAADVETARQHGIPKTVNITRIYDQADITLQMRKNGKVIGQETLDFRDVKDAHSKLLTRLDEGWDIAHFEVNGDNLHKVNELNALMNNRITLQYTDTITRAIDNEKVAGKLREQGVKANAASDGETVILQGSLANQWQKEPPDSALAIVTKNWEAKTGKNLATEFGDPINANDSLRSLKTAIRWAWKFDADLPEDMLKIRTESIEKLRGMGLGNLAPTDALVQSAGKTKTVTIRMKKDAPWENVPLRIPGAELPPGWRQIGAEALEDDRIGERLIYQLTPQAFESAARFESKAQGRMISADYLADLTNAIWRLGRPAWKGNVSYETAWRTVEEHFPEVLPTKENFSNLPDYLVSRYKSKAIAAADTAEDRKLLDQLEVYLGKKGHQAGIEGEVESVESAMKEEIEQKTRVIAQGGAPEEVTSTGFGLAEGERLVITHSTKVSESQRSLLDKISRTWETEPVTVKQLAEKFGISEIEAQDALETLAKEATETLEQIEGPMRTVEETVRLEHAAKQEPNIRGIPIGKPGPKPKVGKPRGVKKPPGETRKMFVDENGNLGEVPFFEENEGFDPYAYAGNLEGKSAPYRMPAYAEKKGKEITVMGHMRADVDVAVAREKGPYFRGSATEGLLGGGKGITVPSADELVEGMGGYPFNARAKFGNKPVILAAEWDKETLWHESTHALTLNADVPWREVFLTEPARRAAFSLAKYFSKNYPRSQPSALLNEAATYVWTAVRMGDLDTLARYGKIDDGVENVLKMARESALLVKMHSRTFEDHLGNRLLQSRMDDIIRRASSDVMHAISTIPNTSKGAIWYDAEAGKWVAQNLRKRGQTKFDSLDELWEVVTEHDPNITSPSYSMALEMKGLRGPIVPEGAAPNGSYPMPEVPVDPKWNKVGGLAISGWFRPFFNWAETVDKRINSVYTTMGRHVPFYEKIRNVDLMYRSGQKWLEKQQEDLIKWLGKVPGTKQKDVFEWIATKPEKRAEAAIALKLTPAQVEAAGKLETWVDNFGKETGIWASNYIKRTYPKLRENEFVPKSVWTDRYDAKSADLFEQWVREGELEATDNHFGRFAQFLLQKGMEKKFIGEPLRELQKMANTQNKDGRYILGPLRGPVERYIAHMRGQSDVSQRAMNWAMQGALDWTSRQLQHINKFLPEGHKINTEFSAPQHIMNRFLVFSYAMGLGGRLGANMRDMAQVFITSMPILGAKNFFGAMNKVLSDGGKSWTEARDAGALLFRKNVGELFGDVISEIPREKSFSDKMVKLSTKMLQPQRWTDNFGRAVSFVGERDRALEWITKYRNGSASLDELVNNTGLWWMDVPNRTRLLNLAGKKFEAPTPIVQTGWKTERVGMEKLKYDKGYREVTKTTPIEVEVPPLPTKPGVPVALTEQEYVKKLADQFGLEYLDTVHWPYRRGGQPSVLTTGAGRVFGQYGMWPMNYLDFMRRGATKLAENPKKAYPALALWMATNYGFMKGFEGLGADSAQWFFQSPAGYAGGPHMQLVGDLMRSIQEDDEGRAARQRVISYPLSFAPGWAEVRSILKGLQEEGAGEGLLSPKTIRYLGMRPFTPEEDKSFTEWLLYETGFKGARRRP